MTGGKLLASLVSGSAIPVKKSGVSGFPSGNGGGGTRGVMAGGNTTKDLISFITPDTEGDAELFGDLINEVSGLGAVASTSRAIFGGGDSNTDVMSFVEISTEANSLDYGNLTVARRFLAGTGGSSRGIFGGGVVNGADNDVIDFCTIDNSPANATSFGDLATPSDSLGAVSSESRAVWGGGETTGGFTNVMQYVAMDTEANAVSYGILTVARTYVTGGSASTSRGLFLGGRIAGDNPSAVIDFITIDNTPTDATSFGDLSLARRETASVSSSSRCVCAGGNDYVGGSGGAVDVMDFVEFETEANATSFGSLTEARFSFSGASQLE